MIITCYRNRRNKWIFENMMRMLGLQRSLRRAESKGCNIGLPAFRQLHKVPSYRADAEGMRFVGGLRIL